MRRIALPTTAWLVAVLADGKGHGVGAGIFGRDGCDGVEGVEVEVRDDAL